MKRAMACGVLVAVTFGGLAPAIAQVDQGVETQHINIDEAELIEGKRKGADMLRMSAKQRSRFEGLSRLKKSMLPQLMETAQDGAL